MKSAHFAFGYMTRFVGWLNHLPVHIHRFRARYYDITEENVPIELGQRTQFCYDSTKLWRSYWAYLWGSPYFGAYHSLDHSHTHTHIMSNMFSSTKQAIKHPNKSAIKHMDGCEITTRRMFETFLKP